MFHAAGGKREYDKENMGNIFFVIIHFLPPSPTHLRSRRFTDKRFSTYIHYLYCLITKLCSTRMRVYHLAMQKIIGQLKSRHETVFVVIVIVKSQLCVRYKYCHYKITCTRHKLYYRRLRSPEVR